MERRWVIFISPGTQATPQLDFLGNRGGFDEERTGQNNRLHYQKVFITTKLVPKCFILSVEHLILLLKSLSYFFSTAAFTRKICVMIS